MANWDYAEMSKMAKKAGGVQKYINLLIESGRQQGRREMIPFVVIAGCVGGGIHYMYCKAKQFFFDEKQISSEEVRQAEVKIVQELENNDIASESDENDQEDSTEEDE